MAGDDDSSSSVTLVNKLDFGDPLYLHVSDTTGTALVSIKLKGTENYSVWSRAMLLALNTKNKTGFVNGTCLRQTYEHDEVFANQWDRCSSVSEYYHKLNTLWKQYDAFIKLPDCSCAAKSDFDKHNSVMKLMQFLWDLMREESHRNFASHSAGTKVQNSAFVAKTQPNTFSRCFEVIGYPPRYIRKPFNQGAPKFTANNNNCVSEKYNESVGSSPFTVEQITKLMSLINEKDNGASTSMNSNMSDCFIQDLMLNKVVGIGDEQDGLYVFNKSVIGINNNSTACSMKLWHSRLGHPASQVLNILKDNLNISNFNNDTEPCDICHQAKQTREPFPLSEHKSLKIGDLLHLDLWGPYKVASKEGLPSAVLSGKSPFELVYQHKPNLSHLKGYKLLSLESKNVFFSRDVKFYETIFPFKQKDITVVTEKDVNHLNFFDQIFVESQNTNNLSLNDEGRESEVSDGTEYDSSSDTVCETEGNTQSATLDDIASDDTSSPEGNVQNQTNVNVDMQPLIGETSELRRTSRPTRIPTRLNDYVLNANVKYDLNKVVDYANLSKENLCFVSNLNKSIEPTCYSEACLDKNWVDAMNTEIDALMRNNTWVLVDLPKGRKPIGSKWVYKIKHKASGEIERYKARLVAKGFSQREGLDYDETFSPVVKMITVRCLITLAVNNDWPIFQLDVNNAFLYGEIVEDVYMKPPEGYFTDCVLLDNGFLQSVNDYSLYTKTDGNLFLSLLVYVDDILITGNDLNEIKRFKTYLNTNFLVKDLGKLKYFLGIEVLKVDNGLCLSQRKYCIELLNEFGLLGSKPVSVPIEQNYSCNTEAKHNDKAIENITQYQKLVGKLIYLTMTRPDISYAVHCLSQFMHNPLQSHFNLALHVLRYLKLSPGKGVTFTKSKDFELRVFTDADWAKSMFLSKSVNGYCVFMGDSLIAWKSKKQNVVARSSAESEYRSMSNATTEVMWIMKVLNDLKVKYSTPIPLFCDNNSAIQMANNPIFHEKTKHLEVDVHFIREKISSGIIKTYKINSEDQIADIFTKGLSVKSYNKVDGFG
ncbi:uncharacterized protein [Rutidosis leptorrhynchoides]|uniref:uncharacterized protein n=1 Tax=Rutidosis leptorrhynchoides TaxID=125765 RepID=UPI003A9A0CA0